MNRYMIAAAVPFLFASASFGDLVVNGSFEDPAITGLFETVGAGSDRITGWGVAGQTVDIVSVAAGLDFVHSGRQSIDLAGTPGPGTIFQDIPTELGAKYDLRFFVSSNDGPYTGAFTVRWNGADIGTFDSPVLGTWNEIVLNDLAGSATGASRLEFVSNIGGFKGTLIDDVSVLAVPAPGAGLLMLGVAGLRRRGR
jgi:hypothetical protein